MILEKTRVAIVGEDWDLIDAIEHFPDLEMAGLIAPVAVHGSDILHLGKDEDWEQTSDLKVILAVDLPHIRAKLYSQYKNALFTFVSPHAYVSSRALLGSGCIVQRGVTIMPHVNLGIACKVNINATIHHDSQVGNFCTIAPGAQILGNVVIEEGAYIGAGAIIKQRCRIGAYSIVGAGAVVVKDVPKNTTVVGVPAKIKRPLDTVRLPSSQP